MSKSTSNRQRTIGFGVIGCGLMGREFASAAARWCHLEGMSARPRIVAVCDPNPAATAWFAEQLPEVQQVTADYHELLANPAVEAIYCAVPHNLHAKLYCDIIAAGKHLLGEKPFGIDRAANRQIMQAMAAHPDVLVRCSSEFPFYPGPYQMSQWVAEGRFGNIIEVEAHFWHSSDLNPDKPINWKRRIATNGEYGCMGDLGMHVAHLPLRYGWRPNNVRALLSNIVPHRPDGKGGSEACETWDNAVLACEVRTADQQFPMLMSTKRIAPGHANTWILRIVGTRFSAEFSSKYPKQLATMPYESGGEQAWQIADVPWKSAYRGITGSIFEFGFSDSILQMWAAFCDELASAGNMQQSFHCATPQEAADSHSLFTAALESQRSGQTVTVSYDCD